jgi:hypothetical protein
VVAEKKWPHERVTHCDVVFEEKEFSVIFHQTTLMPSEEAGEAAVLHRHPVFTAYMTPLHARDLIQSLEKEIKGFEGKFGKILAPSEVNKISKHNAELQDSNKRMKDRENLLLYTIPLGIAVGMIILGILLKWILF